jgi:hypothetical protein
MELFAEGGLAQFILPPDSHTAHSIGPLILPHEFMMRTDEQHLALRSRSISGAKTLKGRVGTNRFGPRKKLHSDG